MKMKLALITIAVSVALVAVTMVSAQTAPTLIQIEGGRIAYDGTLAVDVVGDRFPNGLTGYQLSVTTADPTIAIPLIYQSPDFGLTNLDATSTPGTLRFAMVDLNSLIEVGAVDALLGTVTFLGLSEGIVAIQLTVQRMSDEDGSPILTSVGTGLLTVSASRDLDGDGITEDINGNGFFDFADVLTLFRMLLALPP